MGKSALAIALYKLNNPAHHPNGVVFFSIAVPSNKNIHDPNVVPRIPHHLGLFRQYLTKLDGPTR
jgi:hypothetical protein